MKLIPSLKELDIYNDRTPVPWTYICLFDVLTALTLSESDVYRRQILTYEVDPLAERIRYL